jgi:hypothetical protein
VIEDQVEEWRRLKVAMPRDRFMERFAHPFLLRQTIVDREKETKDEWGGEAARIQFNTDVRDAPVLPTGAGVLGRMRGAKVIPIIKAPGNPFPDRISVGRASNCDIVLRESSVSKLHAHFHVITPIEVELVDTKSANGTRVNAKPVEPLVATRLRNGDSIFFGSVAVQFYDPGRLWDLL